MDWQGTTDGRYLCEIDDHQAHDRQSGRALAGQVTIFESRGRSVLHRLQLNEGVGPVTWPQQQYVPAQAAWRHHRSRGSYNWHVTTSRCFREQYLSCVAQPDSHRSTSGYGPRDGASQCRLHRPSIQHISGNIVIGSQLRTTASSALPLQVCHLPASRAKDMCKR